MNTYYSPGAMIDAGCTEMVKTRHWPQELASWEGRLSSKQKYCSSVWLIQSWIHLQGKEVVLRGLDSFNVWKGSQEKSFLLLSCERWKSIYQWGRATACKIVHCFLCLLFFNSKQFSNIKTKQRRQRSDREKGWSQKIMGYQFHPMELGFCHGGDIITEGFKEEERHKYVCFKKSKWVASLHYKKCVMFPLHIHMSIFYVHTFSCGYLYVYTIHIPLLLFSCTVWYCHFYRSKMVKYYNFK